MPDGTFMTSTGRKVSVYNIRPEDIDIRDIATSLSKTCRYNGSIDVEFYSVAEHSLLVAVAVRKRLLFGPPQEEVLRSPYVRLMPFNPSQARQENDHLVVIATALALLHDAHEMFTGDIVGPFKVLLDERAGGFLKEYEADVDKAIRARFGLPDPREVEIPVDGGEPTTLQAMIKAADKAVLLAEQRHLRYVDSALHPDHVVRGSNHVDSEVSCPEGWLPSKAREHFLGLWRRACV